MFDICIIGAGPSGMAAAIAAAEENPSLNICILEKKEEPGKKLLATGNGRCNLTNANCDNLSETLVFFDAVGIYTRQEEEGRMYPYSQRGADVLEALLFALSKRNVKILTEMMVEKVEKKGEGFVAFCSNGNRILSKTILVATGGKAGPQYGCTGDGYRFAKAFSHTVKKTAPILAGVECCGDFDKIKGVRASGLVSLYDRSVLVASEEGEVQFTEDGLSGICVMNLSRYIKLKEGEDLSGGFDRYTIAIDFMKERSLEDIENWLLKRWKQGLPLEKLLVSVVNGKLAEAMMQNASEGSDAIQILSGGLKSFQVKVKSVKGWKHAQCTAGGVELSEINMETMESTIVENLFFSGEVLDYDGPCGGYNLNNAWHTGVIAGRAMAKAAREGEEGIGV